jgi:hypothetical protein
MAMRNPPIPAHVPGTPKGEERVIHKGREPGRDEKAKGGYRQPRDATSINPRQRAPIDPSMPSFPPA